LGGWTLTGKKSTARKGKKGKTQRGVISKLPPQLSGTPNVDHTFRFINSARGQLNVTYNMLAGMCGTIGTIVNSKVQPIASTIRLRKITVWPGGDSTQQTAEILWNSPATTMEKDNTTITSLPANMSNSAPFVSRPPRGALGNVWTNINTNGSAFCFGINCPIGSVIDVHAVFTIANAYAVPANISVTTAALGGLYFLGLGTTYVAQGVTTTT